MSEDKTIDEKMEAWEERMQEKRKREEDERRKKEERDKRTWNEWDR